MSASTYSVTWDASGLPSGLYLYRLTAGTFTETKALRSPLGRFQFRLF